MYKIKGFIHLHDTSRSRYAVSQLMEALGIGNAARDGSREQVIIDCRPEDCYDLIFISCNDGFKAAEEEVLEALNRAARYVLRGNVDIDTVSDDGAHLTRQRYCLEDGKFVCSTVVIERNIHGRK